MRVALLLSGIVGNMYTRKATYEWEGHVDFRISHHFFKKHIIDANDQVDVFMHCWDTHFEEELVELYKPKKSKFEKQIIFDENHIRRHYIESRWYSAKQVTKLKKEYEMENGFKYDVVMVQ